MLIWLVLCPAAVVVGSGIWSLFIADVAGLGPGFFEVAALSVLAAAPIACLAAAAQHRWAARNAGRAAFSWRICVGIWCLAAGTLLAILTDQQPYWHRIHRYVGLSQMALFIAAAALLALAASRRRRLSRGNASGVRGQ